MCSLTGRAMAVCSWLPALRRLHAMVAKIPEYACTAIHRLDPKSPYTASAGPVRRKRAARAGAPLLPVKRSQADLQAALEAAAAAKAVSKRVRAEHR